MSLDIIKDYLVNLTKEEKNTLLNYLLKPNIDVTNKDLTVVTGL